MTQARALTGLLAALIGVAASSPARADTPAFDRPGIAFATAVLPVGTVALEQGFLDFAYQRGGGASSTEYTADTNFRLGVAAGVEVQLATALWNRLTDRSAGTTRTENGRGDTRLSVKLALPTARDGFSWAVLTSATLATGDGAFTADTTQYDLGVALAQDFGGASGGLYLDATHADGDTSIAFSPSYSVALSDRVTTYAEAGYFTNASAPDEAVAGGGITWMVTPTVQLDASANFGLNSASADVAGGVGFSIYFE